MKLAALSQQSVQEIWVYASKLLFDQMNVVPWGSAETLADIPVRHPAKKNSIWR